MTAIQPALLSTLARAHADDLLAEADRQRLIRQAERLPIAARRGLGRWLQDLARRLAAAPRRADGLAARPIAAGRPAGAQQP